jgi:hypothetical protein
VRKRHTSRGFLSTIERKSEAVVVYRWYWPRWQAEGTQARAWPGQTVSQRGCSLERS